jgi:hypothetical protein
MSNRCIVGNKSTESKHVIGNDSKCFTSITFADVSKAFDSVWIGGLLLKLEIYGIKGDLLMWLKSYLTLRVRICRRF